MLLKYKISESKLDFVNKPMTAKTVYSTYKPTAFINACLYDMATSTNITNVKDETIADGYLFTNEGIGIRNGKPIWTTLNDTTVQDFIAGSPILVKGSKVSIEWGNKISTAIQGKAHRSAIGFNDMYIFLFTSDVTMTLQGLANYMLGQGCKYAINLDGGGSCHLQVGTKTYKKSIRKNASWLLLYNQIADNSKTTGSDKMFKFVNDRSKSLPVYETNACKKKIGSLDPYEECTCLYEIDNFKVVLYNITGKQELKVGFVRN